MTENAAAPLQVCRHSQPAEWIFRFQFIIMKQANMTSSEKWERALTVAGIGMFRANTKAQWHPRIKSLQRTKDPKIMYKKYKECLLFPRAINNWPCRYQLDPNRCLKRWVASLFFHGWQVSQLAWIFFILGAKRVLTVSPKANKPQTLHNLRAVQEHS